ncbi:MAG TPA: hypothetical protein PLW37_00985 [bacterium]|jgi:hypothetical protein|nr:hypothetical protein [bacterium]HQB08416.1 hypothetical protein [bacterium]
MMIFFIILILLPVIFFFLLGKKQGDKYLQKTPSNNMDFYVETKSNTETNTSESEHDNDLENSIIWETVHRYSKRWKQLKLGSGINFPGYGKIYEREFMVWYCDVNSKEKKSQQLFNDKGVLYYYPINSEKITGDGVVFERLQNIKEFKALFSGLDKKNRKRWYFALAKYEPTGIETARELISEEEQKKIEEEDNNVPEGWTLVRRKSEEWLKNGFGDGDLFPGYGKIYIRTFDSWYCKIGSKEKFSMSEFKDKAVINYHHIVHNISELKELKEKNLRFEFLDKTQGYKELFSAVDQIDRKHWYFGLKKIEPTYLYTKPAK